MEYTKDVIFNVQYGENVKRLKLGKVKWISRVIKIYKGNKFIISLVSLTILLMILDLWMVSNFINLFITL